MTSLVARTMNKGSHTERECQKKEKEREKERNVYITENKILIIHSIEWPTHGTHVNTTRTL